MNDENMNDENMNDENMNDENKNERVEIAPGIKMQKKNTWCEDIYEALQTGRTLEGRFLWFSHKKIWQLVAKARGLDERKDYRALSNYIVRLVKGGYVERTITPRHMMNNPLHCGREYLYRLTGKKYERGYINLETSKNRYSEAHIRGVQAFEILRRYPKLPKWFRRMLM